MAGERVCGPMAREGLSGKTQRWDLEALGFAILLSSGLIHSSCRRASPVSVHPYGETHSCFRSLFSGKFLVGLAWVR